MFFTLSLAGKNDDNRLPNKKETTAKLLQGKITDAQSGETLSGVKIYFTEENKLSYSDFDGNFSCFGTYKSNSYLIIEGTGYQSKKISIKDFSNYSEIQLLPL